MGKFGRCLASWSSSTYADTDRHSAEPPLSRFTVPLLPRPRVRLRGNCLLSKRFRQCAAINSQSRARQAIRLVEISSFVENAPLKIEVIHFASVTYVWHSPCISRYCRKRRFTNSATDDELPKEAQRMALPLPIRNTGAFTGIGAVYADRFP